MVKAKDIIAAKGLEFFCEWIKEHGEKVVVDLSDVDLSDVDLRDVDLSDANISGADIGCAHFFGADLSSVVRG